MLKDYKMTPDEPEDNGEGKKLALHTSGVILAFLPGAALLLLTIAFGLGKEDARIIWITLAVCLISSISLASAAKFDLAYLVAIAPLPVMFLVAMISSMPSTRKWTEDVLLDDGKVVQIKRKVKLSANGSEELDASLSFTGELEELPTWRAPLMAIVLYRDKGKNEWVLVATANFCSTWEKYGKPQPPYWEYRLMPTGWRLVPLSEISLGRHANLLHDNIKKIDKRHITVDDRKRLDHPDEPLEGMSSGSRKEWIVSSERYSC